MTTTDWSPNDVDRYGGADEIEISTRRDDRTLRRFVPIWIVAVDGSLYVRSYRGTRSAWYRHASRHPTGAIRANGELVDVAFAPASDDVHDAVDTAYHAKYARYGDTYLRPMLADQAVATTLRVEPQT